MKVSEDVEDEFGFQREPHTALVAVPAGDDEVLPDFEPQQIPTCNDQQQNMWVRDWRDVLFIEIARKGHYELRANFLQFHYGIRAAVILAGIASSTGETAGIAIGALVGLVGGPIGSAIGAGIGAAAARAINFSWRSRKGR